MIEELFSLAALALSAFNPSLIAEKKSAYPNVVTTPPADIYVLSRDTIENNPNFLDYVTIDPSSGVDGVSVDSGYYYSLCFLSANWDGTPEILSLQFARFAYGSGLSAQIDFITPTFFVASAEGLPAVYEYNYFGYTSLSVPYSVERVYDVSSPRGYPTLKSFYSTSYGNAYIHIDVASVAITSYFDTLVETMALNAEYYGYQYYNAGYDEGRDAGFKIGRIEGAESVSREGLVVANLFGAVFGVPIGVLNGLSPFVIWGIPIIGIAFTFLFFGLILWIVKRFV